MKSTQKVLVAILLALFATGVSFAGGGQEEKAAAEEATIQLAISPREIGSVIPPLLEEFQSENPNIEVEWLKVPGVPDEQHTLYVTNLAAKADQPDVIAVDVIWPGEFIANGWAEPLNAYFTRRELEPYLEGMLNSVTVEGKVYGIPLYTNAIHFFYRKDLLDKYNQKVPDTWEELVSVAQEILERENDPNLAGYISMWAQIEGLFMNYLQFFWGAGGEFFDARGNVAVNTAAGKKALQTMVDFIYDYDIAPESILTYKPNDAMALYRQGRVIFMVVQDFVWPMLNADDSAVKGKVMMKRVPYFQGHSNARTVCMGGWILIINPYSRYKEASAKLIKHLTTPEAGLRMAIETGSMPALKGMESNQELLSSYPIARVLYEDFAVGDVRPSAQAGEKYPELSHIMQREIHAALTRQKSVDQALADAQTEIEQLLAE
jgi:multiple sugar transport system substrate-binding protein